MKKLTYNLARSRQVNGLSFALRAALLVLATLLLGTIALTNLAARRGQARLDGEADSRDRMRIEKIERENSRRHQEIAAWKKSLGAELATANSLIARKSFSFTARLDFLEKASSPGIRVRHLSLVNNPSSRVNLSIITRSLKELFALYKKLAPFQLVITSETQTEEEYLVNLSFKVLNEQI